MTKVYASAKALIVLPALFWALAKKLKGTSVSVFIGEWTQLLGNCSDFVRLLVTRCS